MEQAVELMEDIKLRAELRGLLQEVHAEHGHRAAQCRGQSLQRSRSNGSATSWRRSRNGTKTTSLNISGAGEKVRKLIDEHLVSLGINPKIPPVELLSPKFIQEVEKNTSPKAKASEMEHAIRKHCKVHFEEDPAFYAKLSEKLEALIQTVQGQLGPAVPGDLFDLRGEAEAGRKEEIEGVSAKAAPFYDLIGHLAFGETTCPRNMRIAVKQLVADVIDQLAGHHRHHQLLDQRPTRSASCGVSLSDLMLADRRR